MSYTPAGPPPDLEPGRGTSLVLGGQRVAVFHDGEAYHAFADRCPHAGAPLSIGVLRAGQVICAWHGWKFDCDTGRCTVVPDAELVRFPIRERDGELEIELGREA